MNFPDTRPSLISRALRGDEMAREDAWRQLVEGYTGPAMAFLQHRLGLNGHDAEDVWQEVCMGFTGRLGHYDSNQGRFRAWLVGMLRHSCWDHLKRGQAKKRGRALTDSYDAPLSDDDPTGPSRWETLAAQDAERWAANERTVDDALRAALRDYSGKGGVDEVAVYLDWFWNGAPPVQRRKSQSKPTGGQASKPAHDSNAEIAARHGITVAQLEYLRKKVEAHLQKRWDMD
ncbi:MAG: sigma-70 family RNA polymerase sigma factor [Verrucomicrobiae bacterium]|nr:sigma-70 family RNA polymerase sigma factor [Verrucomicrobiae bacterium]